VQILPLDGPDRGSVDISRHSPGLRRYDYQYVVPVSVVTLICSTLWIIPRTMPAVLTDVGAVRHGPSSGESGDGILALVYGSVCTMWSFERARTRRSGCVLWFRNRRTSRARSQFCAIGACPRERGSAVSQHALSLPGHCPRLPDPKHRLVGDDDGTPPPSIPAAICRV
jgi:hypothetical protein